jgi:hypothetical protein
LLSSKPPAPSGARPILYSGDETLEVVGESFHQDTLWKLVGGRTTEPVRCEILAVLVPEPDNPKDRNAVMVLIEGKCVGHLSREDAAAYLPGLLRLASKGPVELEGGIFGGGPREDGIGFLGVFLDHDPRHFGIPKTGHTYGIDGFRTGFSDAVASDLEDDSYDLSWHTDLSDDHRTAIQQLRRMLDAERDPIDRHYMWTELAKRLYKCRNSDETALDEFDNACRDHDAEMVTIRAALLEKFGKVPVIETYRQAAIRCQKAKDWLRMQQWAKRGIAVYGSDAARPEVVEDLHKRLAYALAKIDATESRKPQRKMRSMATAPTIETLVCTRCGRTFERVRAAGRKPHLCPDCRGVSVSGVGGGE